MSPSASREHEVEDESDYEQILDLPHPQLFRISTPSVSNFPRGYGEKFGLLNVFYYTLTVGTSIVINIDIVVELCDEISKPTLPQHPQVCEVPSS